MAAAIEKGIDDFELWKDKMFESGDYKGLRKAAYEAAVWLEDNSEYMDDRWTTLNNATSLLCTLAAKLELMSK